METPAHTKELLLRLRSGMKGVGFLTDVMGRKGNNRFLPLLLHTPRNETQGTEGRLGSAASKSRAFPALPLNLDFHRPSAVCAGPHPVSSASDVSLSSQEGSFTGRQGKPQAEAHLPPVPAPPTNLSYVSGMGVGNDAPKGPFSKK